MRRFFSRLLFSAIAAVAILVGAAAIGLGYRAMDAIQSDYVASVEQNLRVKVDAFQALMLAHNFRLQQVLDQRLTELAEDITQRTRFGTPLSDELLLRLRDEYKVDEIYLVDRDRVIFQTTFEPDLGFDLSVLGEDFIAFYNQVWTLNEPLGELFSISTQTGKLSSFRYFRPQDADFTVEISMDLRAFMRETLTVEVHDFIFGELLGDLTGEEELIQSIDVFFGNRVAPWSLLEEGRPLPPGIVDVLFEQHRITTREGGLQTDYIHLDVESTLGGADTLFIAEIVTNRAIVETYVIQAITAIVVASLLVGFAVFYISSRTVRERLLVRIDRIADGLIRLSEGRYDTRLTIAGNDELAGIGARVDVMADAIQARDSAIRKINADLDNRVAAQTEELTEALGLVSSSIDYASRIQKSILPSTDTFSALFDEHFTIWEPRDRVGGDMYWIRIWGDGVLIIACDCTGHGVPGAFMTLIATGALDRAMEEVPPGRVDGLVQRVHQYVQLTLKQNEAASGSADDGMELGAVYLNAELDRLSYAGARFSLFLVEDGSLSEMEGTRCGIGYRTTEYSQAFEQSEVPVKQGVAFYLTTDGLIDQIGGPRQRSFGKRRLRQMILSLQKEDMVRQRESIIQQVRDFRGDQPRRDDVLMLGFKL